MAAEARTTNWRFLVVAESRTTTWRFLVAAEARTTTWRFLVVAESRITTWRLLVVAQSRRPRQQHQQIGDRTRKSASRIHFLNNFSAANSDP